MKDIRAEGRPARFDGPEFRGNDRGIRDISFIWPGGGQRGCRDYGVPGKAPADPQADPHNRSAQPIRITDPHNRSA
ncbi:hypothetical protein GCM10007382_19300 [Salinibacterium xinjiangense]|uniref:hypothetical protein n=1 Tax=Salinibacterium xinjiangense TaxID=386302 RepID=UPI000BE45DD5|nr:hypothetical protein [Salinibacterium xinjiangense]GGK99304.1 hypothetical protein GCM10007382_19300 [Salinibacterium xinjiangense]